MFFRAFDVGFDNLTCILYPTGFVFLSPNTKKVSYFFIIISYDIAKKFSNK